MSKAFDYTKHEAIPTTHCQTLFRSRLEARWSVFFESTGYDFRYEFKTFQGPTFRYTPDFWVNIDGYMLILEVKPSTYIHTQSDLDKWQWMHSKLDELVAFDAQFAVIYGMPYMNREHATWMKTEKDFSLHFRELPEVIALNKWRSNYREAAKYVFKD